MKKMIATMAMIFTLCGNMLNAQTCATNCPSTDDSLWISTPIRSQLGSSGTFEAWVYPTDLSHYYNVIFCQSYTTGQFQTMLHIQNNHIEFQNGDANGNGIWQSIVSATTVSVNTWYHVAATWNNTGGNTTLNLYINGIKDANSATISSYNWVNSSTYYLCIGGWDQGITNYNHVGGQGGPFSFSGKIDEASVWSVERAQCDIISDMRTGPVNFTNVIGYYQFNESWATASGSGTTDNSGNGNTGTLHNYSSSSQWVTSDAPVFSNGNGCSLSYNNTNSLDQSAAGANANRYINTGSKTLFNNAKGTLEAWVYPTTIGGSYDAIFCQHYSGGQSQTMFQITSAGKLELQNYQGGSSWFFVVGNTTLTTGNWYHVAATWDNSGSTKVLKLYLNGCSDGTYTTTTLNWNTNNTYDVTVGGWKEAIASSPTNNYSFQGYIDEARIWSDELSQADILKNMNQSVPTTYPASLQLYYPFDNSLNDQTSHVLNGTASGTLSYTSNVGYVNPTCSGSNCRLTGIEGHNHDPSNSVSVFPNPAFNEATVSFVLGKAEKVNLNVYDIGGHLISSVAGGTMNAGSDFLKINTSSFAAGMYWLSLSVGYKTFTTKLIVSR